MFYDNKRFPDKRKKFSYSENLYGKTIKDSSKNSLTRIQHIFKHRIQIFLELIIYSMKGLCSKCYSSGMTLVLDEKTSEAICEKCKNL